MVLRARKAWKKKIKVGASFIYFDHDYPYEIVKKRKEYTAIKKLLKEKNIWFQRRKISRMQCCDFESFWAGYQGKATV